MPIVSVFFNLIALQFIVVFIIDLSGIVPIFKRWLSRFVSQGAFNTDNYQLKPFDCSLCMYWWSGLIYLLIVGQFSFVTVMLVALFAWWTPVINNFLIASKEVLLKKF